MHGHRRGACRQYCRPLHAGCRTLHLARPAPTHLKAASAVGQQRQQQRAQVRLAAVGGGRHSHHHQRLSQHVKAAAAAGITAGSRRRRRARRVRQVGGPAQQQRLVRSSVLYVLHAREQVGRPASSGQVDLSWLAGGKLDGCWGQPPTLTPARVPPKRGGHGSSSQQALATETGRRWGFLMHHATLVPRDSTHQPAHGLAAVCDLEPVPGGQVAQAPPRQQLCGSVGRRQESRIGQAEKPLGRPLWHLAEAQAAPGGLARAWLCPSPLASPRRARMHTRMRCRLPCSMKRRWRSRLVTHIATRQPPCAAHRQGPRGQWLEGMQRPKPGRAGHRQRRPRASCSHVQERDCGVPQPATGVG